MNQNVYLRPLAVTGSLQDGTDLCLRGEVFVQAVIERQPAKDFTAGFRIVRPQCETVETKIVHQK